MHLHPSRQVTHLTLVGMNRQMLSTDVLSIFKLKGYEEENFCVSTIVSTQRRRQFKNWLLHICLLIMECSLRQKSNRPDRIVSLRSTDSIKCCVGGGNVAVDDVMR